MELNSEGFYRPKVKGTVPHEAWAVIKDVCPGVIVEQESSSHNSHLNHVWGPIIDIAKGFANNEAVRWQASSGGVLSALLIFLLESKQVDFVVHVGVRGVDPFSLTAGISWNRDDILRHAGSRYAPTAPLENLLSIMAHTDGKCAFVGKPCDIAALRRYMKHDPEIANRVVVLISFFCAGIPSQNATWDLLHRLKVEKSTVKTFRYRGYGWPGQATAVCHDGSQSSMDYNSSWGQVLNQKLQFRCKICPDGIGEMADLVCADAWDTPGGYPDFAERPGISMVIARTKLGSSILRAAINGKYVTTEPTSIESLNKIQPYQLARKRAILARLMAMRVSRRPTPVFRGLYLLENALKGGIIFFLRQFLGMYRRINRN
ncbi:Coenzyme F420 hydrogenase/dehydrogenase, beta subunit C-terminal domain [Candidatus Chloroploca sp. Khr17]|uniref:Coenzyme F420 hydrogenase/dehydrogenase, beta subunit C-terminal domain n=1 Tax=Candidatus Chloroploca sp. Khr17 TaxID=2496869 RepID=UPI0013EDF9B6|nr:Coenzyme F420 hydrogenase/dehydrogenase, beta subunit C-terminal domain [Candidatus Chloroploca sp. Khr17]